MYEEQSTCITITAQCLISLIHLHPK